MLFIVSFCLSFLIILLTLTCITITFSAPTIPTPTPPSFDHYGDFETENYKKHETSAKNSDKETYMAKNYPELYEKIASIMDAIVKKFVYSWFQNINDNDNSCFLNATFTSLNQCVDNITIQIENKIDSDDDLVSNILSKALTLAQQHFATYISIKDSVDKNSSEKEMKQAIAFNKHFKLHQAVTLTNSSLDFDKQVQEYLRQTVESLLLPCLLSGPELSSKLASVLVREILVCNVFKSLLDKLSVAEFWNSAIINISNKILKEQEQIETLRKILSDKVTSDSNIKNEKTLTHDILNATSKKVPDAFFGENEEEIIEAGYKLLENINILSSGKEFEIVLKQIESISTKTILQYLRNVILFKLLSISNTNEIKKKYNKKSILLYRKRLELLLNLIEKIVPTAEGTHMRLSGENDTHLYTNLLVRSIEKALNNLNILQVLNNPEYFKYFSFYVKYSNEDALILLKLWKDVEAIKDPLEDPNTQVDIMCDYLGDSDQNDVKILCKAYLSDISPWFENSPDYEKLLQYNRNPKPSSYYSARQALLLLQEDTQRILQTGMFIDFLKSKEICYLFIQVETPIISNEDILRNSESGIVGSQNIIGKEEGKDTSTSTADIITNRDIIQALDDILHENKAKNKNSDYLFGKRADGIFKQESLFEDEDDDLHAKTTKLATAAAVRKTMKTTGNEEGSIENDDNDMSESAILQNIEGASIESLTLSINNLEKQLSVLKHLILKSELTNNQKELHLLKKSERTILQELDQKKSLKKDLSSNDLFLFNNTNIYITSYVVKNEVSYYNVQITYMAHTNDVQTWGEFKRFSEFVKLNDYLRKKYDSAKVLKFPAKLEMSFNKIAMLDDRKLKLNKFLNDLLSIPQVCLDKTFIEFLTTSSYKSHGLGDSDVSSINTFQSGKLDSASNDLAAGFSTSGVLPSKQNTFVKPMSELFAGIFQLEKGTSIRGMAIMVVLQQLLGGTVEKYIKDLIKRTTSKEKLYDVLSEIDEKLKSKEPTQSFDRVDDTQEKNKAFKFEENDNINVPIKEEENAKLLKKQCLLKLEKLMVTQCSKAVGIKRSKRGAVLVHGLVQNKYLNYSLLLYMLDIIIQELFM